MNEITKIHLGRQPFVIAVDAHKMLQSYLLEIKHQVGKGGEGVINEVEIRMAELLGERGVHGEKVVLADDVAFLKQQLGSPSDFVDDADGADAKAADERVDSTKRLFRDTQNGMLAGVSSGLAAYFGIDAVIIRILFVFALLSGGWGIVVYIILWLIMPEAKTASERLQMRGKAVTVDSLKEVVDRADVPGAAHRVSRYVVPAIESIVRFLLVCAGLVFTVIAAGLLVAAVMAGVYAIVHGGHVIHGAIEFPLGAVETAAVAGGLGVLASVAAFLLVTGMAMIKRRWSLPGWGTAALSAFLFLSVITCGVSMPDAVQSVDKRHTAMARTDTRSLPPFHTVRFTDKTVSTHVVYANDTWNQDGQPAAGLPDARPYGIKFEYLDGTPVKDIKTTISNGELVIDTSNFRPGDDWDCDGLCIGQKDYFTVIINTPQRIQESQM